MIKNVLLNNLIFLTGLCFFQMGAADTYGSISTDERVMPTAVCQDITINVGQSGSISISAADVDGGSSSNLGDVTLMIDQDTFTCLDAGDNPVVLTVTDVNGDTSTCTAIVTVVETTPPVIECPFFFDIATDPGVCTAEVSFVNAISLDNCDGVLVTEQIAGLPSGSDFPLGDNEVIFMSTDASGNSVTCSFIITVVDMEDPIFNEDTLPEDIVRLTDPVEGTYTLEDFTTDATAIDNCSDIIVVSQLPAAGMELDPGSHDITLTAEDEAGNETDYVFELEVEDALGVNENTLDLSSISVQPNPARDNKVLITNPNLINLNTVRIYDLQGRLIQKVNLIDMLAEKNIDMSQLKGATYLLLIESLDGAILTKQIVKE